MFMLTKLGIAKQSDPDPDPGPKKKQAHSKKQTSRYKNVAIRLMPYERQC